MTLHTDAPRLSTALTIWQAWWEGYDTWDGEFAYLDLATAKACVARDYEATEYGEPDQDDEPRTRPDFNWVKARGSWHLIDHGQDTDVQVYETPVYRPATVREIEQQKALQAAEEAERTARLTAQKRVAAEARDARERAEDVAAAVADALSEG